MSEKVIAVWFSCGATSAVAAKMTLELYNDYTVKVLNTPILEEHPDNRRFLADVEQWLGVSIELVTNPHYPNSSCVEVWDKKQAMSFNNGAPCTVALKKQARQMWEVNCLGLCGIVLGYTADEQKRIQDFRDRNPEQNLITPLITAGLTKADCLELIQLAGLKLPQPYLDGFYRNYPKMIKKNQF